MVPRPRRAVLHVEQLPGHFPPQFSEGDVGVACDEQGLPQGMPGALAPWNEGDGAPAQSTVSLQEGGHGSGDQ
eukprot:6720151-Alexandrium_andersonii.AAC.1